MRFISHLDLLRLFQRAARRAGLPLKFSQGFNPHPKIKIEPALKLGLECDDLHAKIVLKEPMDMIEVRKRIETQLPEGIGLREIKTFV